MNIYEWSDTQRNVALDEFLTPIELIEACFKQSIYHNSPRRILDVGANDGRWGKIARKYYPNAVICGIEQMYMVQPDEYDFWFTDDFITTEAFVHKWGDYLKNFDLVIGNPPYTVKEFEGYDENGEPKYKIKYRAEDFVRKALSFLKWDGRLYYLLRSNFRHSLTRRDLFKEHPLYQVWDCTLRPSFYKEDKRTQQYGTKQTNAHDYALFVWWTQWNESWYRGRQLDWKYED